jgi:hypothetical protein
MKARHAAQVLRLRLSFGRACVYRSWTEQLDVADAVEADFRALSEALPEAGRVVHIRNTPERFEVFDARHRPPGSTRSRTRR